YHIFLSDSTAWTGRARGRWAARGSGWRLLNPLWRRTADKFPSKARRAEAVVFTFDYRSLITTNYYKTTDQQGEEHHEKHFKERSDGNHRRGGRGLDSIERRLGDGANRRVFCRQGVRRSTSTGAAAF